MPVALPSHHLVHEKHATAGVLALLAAATGAFLSYAFYGTGWVNPAAIKTQLKGLHGFLTDKWIFDATYDVMFVRPAHIVARWAQGFDKTILDTTLHRVSSSMVDVANWDRKFDETVVDRLVNIVGELTFSAGRSIKGLQTGRLRQYIMFIAFGVLGLFLALFAFLPRG